MKQIRKKQSGAAIVLALFTAGLCLVSIPGEARVGSSSRSMGSSSSYRAPSSSSSSSSASSSRLGGGQSLGMQRSQVVNNARAGGTTTYNGQSAPSSAYPGGVNPYANYQGNTPPAPGYVRNSMGNWVLPAAIGAAAGYALGHATSNNTPAVVNNSAGGNYGDTAPGYGSGGSGGGMGSLFPILLLALLGGGAYYLWKKTRTGATPNRNNAFSSPGGNVANFGATSGASMGAGNMAGGFNPLEGIGQEILGSAKQFYGNLQDLNNRGDLRGLEAATTPDLYRLLAAEIHNRSQPSQTEVVRMETRLLDVSEEGDQYIASVRFIGAVREGYGQPDEAVDEVYHFVRPRNGGPWKLAGIEVM